MPLNFRWNILKYLKVVLRERLKGEIDASCNILCISVVNPLHDGSCGFSAESLMGQESSVLALVSERTAIAMTFSFHSSLVNIAFVLAEV